MTPTARQRLIEHLQSRETTTAVEASHALQTTAANARHHLAALLAEGVIQLVGERQSKRPGRPVNVYALAQPMVQHNLGPLSSNLLEMVLSNTPVESRSQRYQQIAQRLSTPLPPSRSLTQRLAGAIQYLNQSGYRARWEAHAVAPRLILGHCPYSAIITQHPEMCQIDVAILENILSAPVSQIAKLEPGSSGLPHCIFSVLRSL